MSISKNEILWVTHKKGNKTYYITSDKHRDNYYIYVLKDGQEIKLGKSKNPVDLEKRYMN